MALPLLSVATALSEIAPNVVGDQLMVHAEPAGVALPIDTPFANTCTVLMLPSGSVATPVIAVALLTGTNEPLTGARRPTVGGSPIAPVIVMGTFGEVAMLPLPSNTCAFSVCGPTVAGAVKRTL